MISPAQFITKTFRSKDVLQHRCETGIVGQVEIAGNALFFQSFVVPPAREIGRGAEDRLPKISPQFAPVWRESFSHRGFGTLFEVQLRKLCSTLGERAIRKSKHVKIVKALWVRRAFGFSAPQNLQISKSNR